jgi:hypothetical protein
MKRVMVAAAGAAIVMAAAPQAAAEGFQSPSGNIGCQLNDDALRCDIGDRNWAPPPKPADCPEQIGYGQGIILHTYGPARFVCAGDTAMGFGRLLGYGEYHAGGGMSCNSEQSGMRCSNSDGHGFTLSRQGYTLF